MKYFGKCCPNVTVKSFSSALKRIFWPKMAFKVQIIELKQSKRLLKWTFETHRVIVQKNLKNKKDWAPPNYVGWIRSNVNFEVILEVKKAKNEKLWKNAKSFLTIFWQRY